MDTKDEGGLTVAIIGYFKGNTEYWLMEFFLRWEKKLNREFNLPVDFD